MPIDPPIPLLRSPLASERAIRGKFRASSDSRGSLIKVSLKDGEQRLVKTRLRVTDTTIDVISGR